MAISVLNDVANALSQTFAKKIAKQWNRQAVLASLIPTEFESTGNGKNIAWDVSFSNKTAASYAEGDDVTAAEFDIDNHVPATLPWAHYRSSFQVSETQFDAAAASPGSADALVALFETHVMSAVSKLASTINHDLWTGTGTDGSGNPTIVGIDGGALASSGIYGGLSRALYSEWAGNELSNGGVARSLTFDLMEQMDALIYTASAQKPNLIVCDPGTWRKYKGLFEFMRRIEGVSVSQYDTSTSETFWNGIPIHRDRDGYDGTVAFLNTNEMANVFLPTSSQSNEDVFKAESREGQGSSGDEVTPIGLPFRIVPLAKTGDSLKFMVKCVLNLKVRRPNCMGLIQDIDIS